MPNPKKKTIKSRAKTAKRKPKRENKRPVQPDDKLAAPVGSKPLPRSGLTKKLWEYIKKHGAHGKRRGIYRTRSRGAAR